MGSKITPLKMISTYCRQSSALWITHDILYNIILVSRRYGVVSLVLLYDVRKLVQIILHNLLDNIKGWKSRLNISGFDCAPYPIPLQKCRENKRTSSSSLLFLRCSYFYYLKSIVILSITNMGVLKSTGEILEQVKQKKFSW